MVDSSCVALLYSSTLTITHGLFNVLSIALDNDVLSLVDWRVSHFEGIYKYCMCKCDVKT